MIKFLYFYAEWCGPCKVYGPIIEKFSRENNCNVTKIDVDKEYELSQKYGIQAIPTTLIINDSGEVLRNLIGLQSESHLVNLFRKFNI